VPELRNRPRIIAHRGMSSLAPENTLSAFRLCAAHGVSWFEFDCDVLADGTAVVIHDATLDRTTNQTGDYRALATADLAGIDAGSWFGAGFAGELELLDPARELLVSSFNPLLLAEFHRTAPRWPVACLYENHQFAAVWRSVAGLLGATAIHPGVTGLERDRVRRFRAAGYDVNVWTVNSVEQAQEFPAAWR